jgi:hypothetical protein
MIRLSKLVKEGEEPKKFSNEVKKHFLEIVSTYAKYQEMLDRKSDIAEIAEILGGITEAARELAINEADSWFDANTVKRNMNELTKLGKSFDQVALEAKALDERLNALYEDMGHILSRYYKIGDITEEQMQERLGLREDGKLQGGEEDPCWKGYEMVGMKSGKGGKQVPNCVPKNESVNEAGVPKMYVKYLAVQKKIGELEQKQKEMAKSYFAEKEINKKDKMLQDLRNGTRQLTMYRKNLMNIEDKYINDLYADAEYQGESIVKESKSECGCTKVSKTISEASHGYKDSAASYITKHKNEYKVAEKLNNGNETNFYDKLSDLEEKVGYPRYMIFLSNALRGYKVDMYQDPKIKNKQEAEEALYLLSK